MSLQPATGKRMAEVGTCRGCSLKPTQGLLVWGVGAGSPVPKPALQVLPSCAQRPDLHGLGLCTVPGSQGLRAEEGALGLKLGHCHFGTRHKSVGPG